MDSVVLLSRLAMRNVLRNKRRTLLTLLAIAAGILSATMIAALARGMSDNAIRSAINNFTGHIQIHHTEFLNDPAVEYRMPPPSAELRALLDSSSVAVWSSRVRVPGVLRSERETAGVTIMGIDPDKELQQTFLSDAEIEGELIASTDDDGLVLGEALIEQLQTRVGKRVVLLSQHADGPVAERGFRIIGSFNAELEATEKTYAFTGRAAAQKLLGIGEQITEIAVTTGSRDHLDGFLPILSAAAPGLSVDDWKTLEPFAVALVKVQNGFLYIWYAIVIITIAFGLVNTLFMAVYERVREIGLLQALGMYPLQIVVQIVFESLVLLLGGAALGNALTLVLLLYFSGGIDLAQFAEGTEMFGVGSTVFLNLRFDDWLIANGLIVLLGTLASAYPAWKAGKLKPAEAFAYG